MNAKLFAVLRPDGTRIDAEPGINREFALWSARERDERLDRIVQPNRTNNVTQARRAGYGFEEITELPFAAREKLRADIAAAMETVIKTGKTICVLLDEISVVSREMERSIRRAKRNARRRELYRLRQTAPSIP